MLIVIDGLVASHPMVLDFLGSQSEVIPFLVSMEPQEVGILFTLENFLIGFAKDMA